MKKYLIFILILVQMLLISEETEKNTNKNIKNKKISKKNKKNLEKESNLDTSIEEILKDIEEDKKILDEKNEEEKEKIENKEELKKFNSLEEAANEYARAMQEISNYEARKTLKSLNIKIDEYVNNSDNNDLKNKWEDINNKLLEQYEVIIGKIDKFGSLGDVTFIVKGYDEENIQKYMSENYSEYLIQVENSDEIEFNIDNYVNLEYNYLQNQEKIEIARYKMGYIKTEDGWKIIEKNKK